MVQENTDHLQERKLNQIPKSEYYSTTILNLSFIYINIIDYNSILVYNYRSVHAMFLDRLLHYVFAFYGSLRK